MEWTTEVADLGMLWYGVTGVSFNPADPAEVMLNTGTAAPLLSDHPRPLVPTTVSYGEQPAGAQHTQMVSQMLYDPNTGDYITQHEYMYESYDGYDEDSSGSHVMQQQGTPPITDPNMVGNAEESPPPLPKSKKPKVHHHPALKLKTPIAYQKDTDLNAIPIMREGMAVCEKCGAIGVKHAFYGKERKFCSLACARGPLPPSHHHLDGPMQVRDTIIEMEKKIIPMQKVIGHPPAALPQGQPLQSPGLSTPTKPSQVVQPPPPPTPVLPEPISSPTYLPPPESTIDLDGSFSWATSYLSDPEFTAVPVSCFRHAPMSECWEQMGPGMKVEVACKEEGVTKDAFWVASVIAIEGYKARLRFEGFVEDSSKDFWVDLCSEEVHPVGWCATQGRPLIPPRTIQHKYRDWKEFLMRRLTGARTLPTNFVSRVVESQKSRFRPGLNVEVVDKNRIAQMRVATVTEVVGKRLHLKYHGAPPDDNGFWCHEDAPIIHPVGWSREVGHEIVASQSYHEKCICGTYDPNDAPPELFISTPIPAFAKNAKLGFLDGMKLEAIDPLNLSALCVATVMKVLHNNYLMIRIDSYESDNTCSDWFCYHATSPCIFPAGFCELNNITLTPPRGYEGQFSWFTYLKKTNATAAPPALFNREVPSHGFEEGMALESADLMDPRLVCVATVKQVKGRLLKVHFDGWESDFDQWIDYQSPDIYPVGWCEMSGYRLEGPKSEVPAPLAPKRKVKGGKFGKSGRRGRPYGSKKIGRGGGMMGTIPAMPVGQPQRRRGRPPKEKPQNVESSSSEPPVEVKSENESTELSDQVEAEFEQIEHPSNRGRRTGGKKDARRSPRAALSSTPATMSGSNVKSLPARATRARNLPASYSQSDEEDLSDETSSGVASLDGNESSREPWDTDEKDDIMAAPPTTLVDDLDDHNGNENHLSLESDEVKECKSEDVLPDQFSNQGQTAEQAYDYEPKDEIKNEESTASQEEVQCTQYQNQATTNTSFTIPANREPNRGIANISESHIRPQPTALNNGAFQHSQTTHQSSTVSSTVTAQAQSNPQVTSSSSSTQNVTVASTPYIPRLIDGPFKDGSRVQPKLWSPQDVARFLKTNDCGAYTDNFVSQNINGTKLLTLSQNEVMGLTGMKVGPSLKIHDLVQQLLALVNPAQARYQATLMKRSLSFT